MEKLIFNRLYEFLETFDSLYNLQFGFRSKHSTTLISITENIINAFIIIIIRLTCQFHLKWVARLLCLF